MAGSIKKKILTLILASVMTQCVALSAPSVNGIIPQAGTINTHDIDTLKTQMFKVQIALKEEFSEETFRYLNPLSYKKKRKKKSLRQGPKNTQQKESMPKT